MGDIIRIKGKYYVLTSSALADDRTRVLKYGDTFAVFNRDGDIEAAGRKQLGLFHAETRHLDRMTIRLDGRTPLLLSSTVRDDNAFLSVDLTNVDIDGEKDEGISRGTLHVYRSVFLDDGICYQQLRLMNYGLTFIDLTLSFEFDADYADIFEVRGTPRRKKGRLLPANVRTETVALSYLGLDQVKKHVNTFFARSCLSDGKNSWLPSANEAKRRVRRSGNSGLRTEFRDKTGANVHGSVRFQEPAMPAGYSGRLQDQDFEQAV